MKRTLTFILAALLLGTSVCRSTEPEFKFGLEWGFATTIYRYYYEYYYDLYGTVMETDSYFLFLGNGQVLGNAGIYFGSKFCASLHCGYMGIHSKRSVVPLLARFTFFPSGYENKGVLWFVGAGPAFCADGSRNPQRPCIISNAGVGYRIKMSSDFSMDFLVSARASFDNPAIWDAYTKDYIPSENVRKSVSNMYSLEFSVALNF